MVKNKNTRVVMHGRYAIPIMQYQGDNPSGVGPGSVRTAITIKPTRARAKPHPIRSYPVKLFWRGTNNITRSCDWYQFNENQIATSLSINLLCSFMIGLIDIKVIHGEFLLTKTLR